MLQFNIEEKNPAYKQSTAFYRLDKINSNKHNCLMIIVFNISNLDSSLLKINEYLA